MRSVFKRVSAASVTFRMCSGRLSSPAEAPFSNRNPNGRNRHAIAPRRDGLADQFLISRTRRRQHVPPLRDPLFRLVFGGDSA